jgi:hypothetical protein
MTLNHELLRGTFISYASNEETFVAISRVHRRPEDLRARVRDLSAADSKQIAFKKLSETHLTHFQADFRA